MERHWQLLSGDKRFIRVRMCIVIRLLLLLLLLLPPHTYWKNLGGFSITLVLMMQIHFACLPLTPAAEPSVLPLSEVCSVRSLHYITTSLQVLKTFCISPSSPDRTCL